MRSWTALLVAAATLCTAPSRAADDGAYGRLEGDVSLEARAGAAFASGGPAFAAELGAVYLATAGVYAHYTDALGGDADVRRLIAAGVQLRPLFWARYAKGLETGPPRLDLVVDSVGLGLGVFWDDHRVDGFADDPGLELALGLVFPFLEDATGPFFAVRGALRWRAVDLEGRGGGDLVDQGALLSLTLGWHHVVGVHLVDLRDCRGEVGVRRGGAVDHARWSPASIR